MSLAQDEQFMQLALEQAKLGMSQGEIPVGAILVKGDQVIAQAYNQPITKNDPSAHAEINVLRLGGQLLNNYRLVDTTLYVTLEPCLMCAGAITHARVSRLVYGASDPKIGTFSGQLNNLTLNHHLDVKGGVCAQQGIDLLQQFFKQKRTQQES